MSRPKVKNCLHFPLILIINQDRCRFGVGSSRTSLIIVRVVGFDNRTVDYSFLLPIYPRIDTNCVVLGMFIVFDNDKGTSPSWLVLPAPARFHGKFVTKYHSHSPYLNRVKLVPSLSRSLRRYNSCELESLVCCIADFLVSVVIIVRGRNCRRVDSVDF